MCILCIFNLCNIVCILIYSILHACNIFILLLYIALNFDVGLVLCLTPGKLGFPQAKEDLVNNK